MHKVTRMWKVGACAVGHRVVCRVACGVSMEMWYATSAMTDLPENFDKSCNSMRFHVTHNPVPPVSSVVAFPLEASSIRSFLTN